MVLLSRIPNPVLPCCRAAVLSCTLFGTRAGGGIFCGSLRKGQMHPATIVPWQQGFATGQVLQVRSSSFADPDTDLALALLTIWSAVVTSRGYCDGPWPISPRFCVPIAQQVGEVTVGERDTDRLACLPQHSLHRAASKCTNPARRLSRIQRQ